MQYYWRQYELHITDYDDSYHEKRDRKALELAAQGDRLSVSVLQRIIARDKDLQNTPTGRRVARGYRRRRDDSTPALADATGAIIYIGATRGD